jgi:hypothetical protein
MEIADAIRQDWDYLAKARLHEITAKIYLFAALMGSGDSFHASLTDSVAPVAARKFVANRLRTLIEDEIVPLDVVAEVNYITDEFIEVVLK